MREIRADVRRGMRDAPRARHQWRIKPAQRHDDEQRWLASTQRISPERGVATRMIAIAMRDDDERSAAARDRWDDRERGWRERYGMGQSGYGAGRTADDRSIGSRRATRRWSGRYERPVEDRRSGAWGPRRSSALRARRLGCRAGRPCPRATVSDGDRPSFDRGVTSAAAAADDGGGYEPMARWAIASSSGYGTGGYGDGGVSGYRQHQTGPAARRAWRAPPRPHRGKGRRASSARDERHPRARVRGTGGSTTTSTRRMSR